MIALCLVKGTIMLCKQFIRSVSGLIPAHDGIIVMCACIAHTVFIIQMRQIVIFLFRVKCKFQNLHSGITRLFEKLYNTGCHVSEVLRNNRNISKTFFHFIKELHFRTFQPLAVDSRFRAVGNGIELVKRSEMVYSCNVVHS